MRGRCTMRVAAYGLMAGLALGASGCAAVLIGGAVAAGGAAAGYAYYKGDVPFDFPAPFHPTWVAALSGLQDLGLPVVHYSLNEGSGEIQSRTPEGENITLYLEPATAAGAAVTRVHARIGVFGSQAVSEKIHAQISTRLQNPAAVPPPGAGASPPGGSVPPAPGAVAMPKETAAPPLAGAQGGIVPVSGANSSPPVVTVPVIPPPKSEAK